MGILRPQRRSFVSRRATWPFGRSRGCLPRRFRPGEICPRAQDHIKLIPKDEWEERAKEIKTRHLVEKILNQGQVGSCATESTTGDVMLIRALQGLPFVELNPWFIYHTTSGGRDQGSSIDENLAFVRENGIAPVSVWPRDKGWRAAPSEEAKAAALEFRIEEFYDVASVEEMVSCVLSGFPVVYGADGHSVLRIEYLLDLNSWGDDWEDGGFGLWADYDEVNFSYGAYAVRTTSLQK